MQACTELLPPTAVTHAVTCRFLGPRCRNLIIAKSSLLQIFDVKSSQRSELAQNDGDLDGGPNGSSLKEEPLKQHQSDSLILVGEYPLSGTITSLKPARLLNTKTGGDALLVSAKDAKIAIIEWDAQIHSITTTSLHLYEQEGIQGAPWDPEPSLCPSYLLVDPGNRCAALKFGVKRLAILPFRQAGDDVAMEDYDRGADTKPTNGDLEPRKPTPYNKSFILPLGILDQNLTHVVHLAFLYEYREPTLGILSSTKLRSSGLLEERKDILSYSVFTLDIEEKARTQLLSVTGLPSDLHRVIPLPLPVGGSLLLGNNEIIHVDQSGKTFGVSVNEFAKIQSSFSMTDQSDLNLKLEDSVCVQHRLNQPYMLLITRLGEIVHVTFRMDGRSLSGISLATISENHGGILLAGAPSCAATVGPDLIFVGSEDVDSILLRLESKQSPYLSRKRSHAEMVGVEDVEDEEDEEELEDEDDLYAAAPATTNKFALGSAKQESSHDVTFTVQDRLLNLTPVGEPVIGCVGAKGNFLADLLLPITRGRSGALAVLNHGIKLKQKVTLPGERIQDAWLLQVPLSSGDGAEESVGTRDLLIATYKDEEGDDRSSAFNIEKNTLDWQDGTDLESDVLTKDVQLLHCNKRVIQVTGTSLISLDVDLALDAIVLMTDPETDAELKILHTSFSDPWILVIRDDRSVMIYSCNDRGEIEDVTRTEALMGVKWLSGSLYKEMDRTYAFLLTEDGGLRIFDLQDDLESPIYVADALAFLPPYLSPEFAPRRFAGRAEVVELLATNLGDGSHQSLHLIIRTIVDDIIVLSPYNRANAKPATLEQAEEIRWLKVATSMAPTDLWPSFEEERSYSAQMKIISLMRPYHVVSVRGIYPRVIAKAASTAAASFSTQSKQKTTIVGHTSTPNIVLCLDNEGHISLDELLVDRKLGFSGWTIQNIDFEYPIVHASFHRDSGLYALAMEKEAPFVLPEDEWHHEWEDEDITLRPSAVKGIIRLYDPQTWNIVDEYELEDYEIPTSMKCINLEVSEVTNDRKNMLIVGSAVAKGEDLALNAGIHVFDIIKVVPKEDKPHTDRKLKLLVRQEVRGAVTRLSAIGAQGFLLAAQGQKCMVRGLKEDGTLLPVAFMDMQCYVSVIKNLDGTGLILLGDVMKGIWFADFTEEPFALKLLGKSRSSLEVMAADFMPQERQLYVLVADAQCNLHVLEYNPEHPKSLSGQRLLYKSTFHCGHFPVSMSTILSQAAPDTQASGEDAEMVDDGPQISPESQILMTTQSGALMLITPLEEQAYRRLGALQTHLNSTLEHACGLNQKSYRAVESEGFGTRGILDGQILVRWREMGSQRRGEACARVGDSDWQVRKDLEVVSGMTLKLTDTTSAPA